MTKLLRSLSLAAGLLSMFTAQAEGQITFLNSFGSSGNGAGQFEFPTGVAVDDTYGVVYVSDTGNGRLEAFSLQGTNPVSFGSGLSSPIGLALDGSGNLYVADQNHSRIVEFASIAQDGNQVAAFGSFGSGPGQLSFPVGVAVDTTLLNTYVGDTQNNRIQIFNSLGLNGGAFGSFGSGNGQLSSPHGVAVVPEGSVFVADSGNNRIEEFGNGGNYITQFGGGVLNFPTAVALNSNDQRLYVADQNNNRIAVYSTSGTLLTSFGASGNGAGKMSGPDGVAVSETGMVYVADTNNNRVERWFDPASWTAGTNSFTNSAVGPTSVAVGTGQILGASLSLTAGKGLVVSGSTTVQSGGTLTVNGGTLSTGSLNVAGGGLFDATHGGTFSMPSQVSVIDTGSAIKLDGGTQVTTPIFYTEAGGLLQIGNATLNANGPPLDAPQVYNAGGAEIRLTDALNALLEGQFVSNYGLIDGSGRISGSFNNFAGTVQVTSGQSLNVLGAATSGGLLALSGGGIQSYSSLALQAGSAVQFDLAGTNGTQYGQIDVAGAFSITGSLTVTFAGGFDPHNGEQFRLFSVGSQSGTFGSLSLPTLDPGLHWDTSLLYSQGVLRVSIPGDANNDSVVNGLDIADIASFWLKSGAGVTGDVNGDGVVNGLDIALVASHWLQTYGSLPSVQATVVPEPETIVPAAVAVVFGLATARRRGCCRFR